MGQPDDLDWYERLLQQLQVELDAQDPILLAHRSEILGWIASMTRWREEDAERERVKDAMVEKTIEWGVESRRVQEAREAEAARRQSVRKDEETLSALHEDIARWLHDAGRELDPIVSQRLPYHVLPTEAQLLPFRS